MAGLVPAIHVFAAVPLAKTWTPAQRPGMTEHERVLRSELMLLLRITDDGVNEGPQRRQVVDGDRP
jgi:hypothetical protein